MSRILENRFYNFVLLTLTVCLSIAYVWLGGRVTAPRLSLPSSISSLKTAERGHEFSLEESLPDHALVLTGVINSLRAFDASISLVGGLRHPIVVVLNFEEPTRYLVTDSRVELGSVWWRQTGQLEKSLTKAWVFQMARADISASLLRTEVASDLLGAMLNGDLKIENLSFPEVSHWFLFASSFASHCSSPWLSLELSGLCASADAASSDAIQAIGFRPLLDAMVWSVFRDLSLDKRIEFIRAWTLALTKEPASSQEAPSLLKPMTIDDWRSWLRAEFSALMPARALGERSKHLAQMELGPAMELVLAASGLEGPRGFEIHYLFRSTQAGFKDTESLAHMMTIGNTQLWKTPVTAIAATPDGYFTLPGRARLPVEGTEFLKFRETVWEGCAAPDLHEVLTDSVHSDHVLLVQSCGEAWRPLYSPLITLGVQGFAAANPSVAFALVRKLSMQLASQEGMTPKESLLRDLLERSDELNSVSPNIGLRAAKWHSEIRAYQVLGAVEAVEWYRSTKDL